MATEILYHGANGDRILGILTNGAMAPRDGKIFFAANRWESALMHGADTRRVASFVIKIEVQIPGDVIRYRTATAGVADTIVLQTTQPVSVRVLELYARKPATGGFQVQHVIGPEAIRHYLGERLDYRV